MHKKIGLQKALLTFPSYVLLTNELHPFPDETTILGEALFLTLPRTLHYIKKCEGRQWFFTYFFNFPYFHCLEASRCI